MPRSNSVPKPLPQAEKAPVPHPAFDQKVLEAVVNALDARLHEHSSQVERQLRDLEARATVELKMLHEQDRSVADGLQARIEELQEQFSGQLAAIRGSAETDRKEIQEQFAGLRHDVADLLNGQLDAFQQEMLAEVRQSMGNVAAMAAHPRRLLSPPAADQSRLRPRPGDHLRPPRPRRPGPDRTRSAPAAMSRGTRAIRTPIRALSKLISIPAPENRHTP